MRTVSGADAKTVIRKLESDVKDEKAVIIGFRIADIYPETFTFEKGDNAGQMGVTIKGRLLRVKFAKVNGKTVEVPQSDRSNQPERATA